MDTLSTIVAAASPHGHAARGIVRTSGREACAHVAAALDASCPAREDIALRRRGVHLVRLAEPAIPAIVLVMPGPASATGEDCVEVHAVGNPVVLDRVMDAVIARSAGGARRAAPGEFSARAVLNGRIAVAEAERVSAAIAAETDSQLAAAEELRSGGAERVVASVADALASALALVEAGIDFTDQEDVTAIARPELERRLRDARGALLSMVTAAAGAERATRAPHVVLMGPPNAGKSALFNALAGFERTVASPERGTTRDAVEVAVVLPGGIEALLVDVPGLDDSAKGIDLLAQRRSADALRRADVVLSCTPAGAEPGPQENRVHLPHAIVIDVVTKCDVAPCTAATHGAAHTSIRTSAVTGDGLDRLRSELARVLAVATPRAAHRSTLGRARIGLVGEAVSALNEALASDAPELVAASMRAALDRLGEVAGAIPPDDVLGRLFAGFCIGK